MRFCMKIGIFRAFSVASLHFYAILHIIFVYKLLIVPFIPLSFLP